MTSDEKILLLTNYVNALAMILVSKGICTEEQVKQMVAMVRDERVDLCDGPGSGSGVVEVIQD